MISSVLLIDDDQISTELNRRLLMKINKDISVQIQNDAQDALNYLQIVRPPDLIFLDLNMPGMDGLNFLNEFRKLNLNSKIIVLTSFELRQETMQMLKDIGCSDVIIKPLSIENVKRLETF